MKNPSVLIVIGLAACFLAAFAGYTGGRDAGIAEASLVAQDKESHMSREENQLVRENAALKEDIQSLKSKMDVREQQARQGMATLAQQGVDTTESPPVPVRAHGFSWTTKLAILGAVGAVILMGILMIPGGVAVGGMFGFPVFVVGGIIFAIIGVCLLL
jgi:hypothetical protein